MDFGIFILKELGFHYDNLHLRFVVHGEQHEMKCLLMWHDTNWRDGPPQTTCVSELLLCSGNFSEPQSSSPLWVIFHLHVWVSDSLFTCTWGRKAKITWLGVKTHLYFCCLQCPDSICFNEFLTMHEFESEEWQERLRQHMLIMGYKGQKRHQLFTMPTTLNALFPFRTESFPLQLGARDLM